MKKLISHAVVIILAFLASGAPAVRAQPLLPLFFFADEDDGTEYPHYTSTDLQLMSTESIGVWGLPEHIPTGGDWEALKSANPDYVVIAYVNGGQQDDSVAAMHQLEADRMHLIQMYSATTLQTGVDSSTETITVADATMIPVTGGAIDPDAFESGNGCTDPTYGEFISFIRIGSKETGTAPDAEILRVIAKSGNTLTVRRHTDNSNASGHPPGARVLAPVHVKNKHPRDCTAPDQQEFVRFTLNIATRQLTDLLVNEYIAPGMRGTYPWDGVWLDTTAPSFFNMVDASNEGVTPFDTVHWKDYTTFTRASHHDQKIARIQQALLDPIPFLTANNNGDGKWFYENGYGRRFALATTGGKLRAVNGVVLEAPFTNPSNTTTCTTPGISYDGMLPDPECIKPIDKWKQNLFTIADATENGLSVMPFIKVIRNGPIPFDIDDDVQAFSWASVLLAWGSQPAGSAVVPQLWKDAQIPPDPTDHVLNLPKYFYDNMGLPTGRAPANEARLDALLIGTTTYRRRWTNAMVLVNPGNTDDITDMTGYDPTANCNQVTVGEMPAYSYKILFAQGFCTAWL